MCSIPIQYNQFRWAQQTEPPKLSGKSHIRSKWSRSSYTCSEVGTSTYSNISSDMCVAVGRMKLDDSFQNKSVMKSKCVGLHDPAICGPGTHAEEARHRITVCKCCRKSGPGTHAEEARHWTTVYKYCYASLFRWLWKNEHKATPSERFSWAAVAPCSSGPYGILTFFSRSH